MDDIDQAYVDSLIPDGGIVTNLITVVGFVGGDGQRRWKLYCSDDESIAMTLGLLDLAKAQLLDQARAQDGL